MGSSPLARGLLGVQCRADVPGGIIPARAGFTPQKGKPHEHDGDHPRSRGVYQTPQVPRPEFDGSSPLARGLRSGPAPSRGRAGIIPARAGFTGRRPARRPRGRDHPRSRGVYQHLLLQRVKPVGSSPLARGLPPVVAVHQVLVRIIPARAGFTLSRKHPREKSRDHPRSRGVYILIELLPFLSGGSSPLARGLLRGRRGRRGSLRIIPARAGFTGPTSACPRRGPDHPRSRGVYLQLGDSGAIGGGSSPLARGLPEKAMFRSAAFRIIPARAGFTRRDRR